MMDLFSKFPPKYTTHIEHGCGLTITAAKPLYTNEIAYVWN